MGARKVETVVVGAGQAGLVMSALMSQAGKEHVLERLGEPFPAQADVPATYKPPELERLDLRAEGISTVLWTSGYRPAFDWVEPPVLDDFGLPVTDGGRTAVDGLAFLGTPWMVDMGSANLIGLVRDAEDLAARW